MSGTSNLGANVTTTGTQTYTGAVTLSAATVTLTTTNSDVTFGGTIDSDADQTRNLTINTGGTTGSIQFGGLVGDTVGLGAISITGNLDLDANIVDAASLAVSGASNLGANVTTSGTQTYTGAVTLSAATVTLTTTNNGDISFNNVVDGDYNLQVNTHGTGDTTFAQAVGANTALNNITITTDSFTAAAIKADGTFSLTNLTASTISGILSETSALALIKAGAGTLTLSAVNTFTGDTTISAGDVVIGGSGQLGSGSYGGAISIASGSTFSFASSVSQTLSGVISGDGDVEKITNTSTLMLSGDNTYTGGTNVSAGYLKSGSSSGASPPTSGPFGTATVTVAAGAVLDVNGQTVGNAINLSGTGISSNGAIINSSTTAATISADITLAAHSSVGGSNAVTLSGAISGGYNFTKVGSSTYTLSGTNTYTGDTTINTGTLYITNTNALGTTGGSTTIESGAQLTIATDLIVAEDMNISGTGISSAGVINSSGAMTLSGDINVVATASIITTGNLTFSGNIVKTSGSNATLTISTDAQLQFMNASAITATNNALSLELTSDADSLGNEVIKLGANITTNGGSLTVNSDTYLTKYIEINTTGTSDGAVTFSGLVQGYIADENRIILTGGGGYYYYDVTNSSCL